MSDANNMPEGEQLTHFLYADIDASPQWDQMKILIALEKGEKNAETIAEELMAVGASGYEAAGVESNTYKNHIVKTLTGFYQRIQQLTAAPAHSAGSLTPGKEAAYQALLDASLSEHGVTKEGLRDALLDAENIVPLLGSLKLGEEDSELRGFDDWLQDEFERMRQEALAMQRTAVRQQPPPKAQEQFKKFLEEDMDAAGLTWEVIDQRLKDPTAILSLPAEIANNASFTKRDTELDINDYRDFVQAALNQRAKSQGSGRPGP